MHCWHCRIPVRGGLIEPAEHSQSIERGTAKNIKYLESLGYSFILGNEGKLAGQILSAMETAANRNMKEYSRYGSDTYKQVYIYGGLDPSPTVLNRSYGLNWGLGGWLLTPFIAKAGNEIFQKMRQRVADEITTTFASNYTKEVSLSEMLDADSILTYAKQATGEKYLVTPHK